MWPVLKHMHAALNCEWRCEDCMLWFGERSGHGWFGTDSPPAMRAEKFNKLGSIRVQLDFICIETCICTASKIEDCMLLYMWPAAGAAVSSMRMLLWTLTLSEDARVALVRRAFWVVWTNFPPAIYMRARGKINLRSLYACACSAAAAWFYICSQNYY